MRKDTAYAERVVRDMKMNWVRARGTMRHIRQKERTESE